MIFNPAEFDIIWFVQGNMARPRQWLRNEEKINPTLDLE